MPAMPAYSCLQSLDWSGLDSWIDFGPQIAPRFH